MSPQDHGPAHRTPPRRPPAKRLPAAVYWRRRAVVFGTPVVVLIAIVALFSGGGSKPQQASLTGASTARTQPRPSVSESPASQIVDPNAIATGNCSPSAIQVTPSITKGIAGQPIEIDLALSTTSTACNFAVSGQSVALEVMSGTNQLWSSQACPNVVPAGTLTLRKAAPVDVSLTWDGHQSNTICGASNPWVNPGSYQVLAAVIGSTPTSANFSLTLPTAKTVTKTASPKVKSTPTSTATAKATSKATSKPTTKPTSRATTRTTSSVKGKGTSCGGDNAPGTC